MASRSNLPTKGEEHGDKRITYRSTDPSFNITQGLEECRVWIEAVTGDKVPDFASCCKNGVPLCKLLNCIVPGIIPRINNDPKTPHKERENIAMFLMGCRSMGLQEQMLFNVEDLYESKNLRTVAVTVHWLGKLVQKNYPDIPVFDPTGQSPLKIGGGGNNFASSRPPETPITERDKNRAREPSRIQSVRAPSQVIKNVITCSECRKPLPANRNSFMNQNLYYCRECLCSNCSEPFRHRPKVTAGQNNYCPECVCFKCNAVIYDFYVPDGNNKICLRCCCNYCRVPLKVSDTPPFCILCRCHRCQVGLGEVYYVDNLGKNYCEICADEIRIRNSQRASNNNANPNNNNRGIGSQSAGGAGGSPYGGGSQYGNSPYGGGSQYGSGAGGPNPSNSIYGGPQYGSRASSNDGPGSHHGGPGSGGAGGAGGSPYGGGSQYGNSPYGGGSQYGSGAGGAPRGSQAGGPGGGGAGGAGGSPYGGGSQYGGSGGQPRASQSQGGIQAAHSANAKKQCPGCGSALSGQQVEMDGIRYHKQCFKCDICRSVATVLINGRPYCANCHPDPETCCVCGQSLRGGGLEALGRFYHDNCFKCEVCSALLGGRFKELDRKIMCYNCAK